MDLVELISISIVHDIFILITDLLIILCFKTTCYILFLYLLLFSLDHLSSISQEKVHSGHYSGSGGVRADQQDVSTSKSQRHRITSLFPRVKVRLCCCENNLLALDIVYKNNILLLLS